jgi:elongation factor P hydroxylase
MIAGAEQKQANGEAFSLFPAVHAGHKETIANSMHFGNLEGKANNPNPNFAKQVQHLMSNVTKGLEKTLEEDKKTLQYFIKTCG